MDCSFSEISNEDMSIEANESDLVIESSMIHDDSNVIGKKKKSCYISESNSEEEYELDYSLCNKNEKEERKEENEERSKDEKTPQLSNSKQNSSLEDSLLYKNKEIKEIQKNAYRESLQNIKSRSPSPEHDAEIIDITSDEEVDASASISLDLKYKPILKEQNIFKHNEVQQMTSKIEVSTREYQKKKDQVQNLESEILKTKNIMRAINMNGLPDKGEAFIRKLDNLTKEFERENKALSQMVILKVMEEDQQSVWERIRAGINDVEPSTSGKKGIETHNVQKALTLDRLEQLHVSLKNCPSENSLADDPTNLKVELLPHQKYALSWLTWRESQKPSGGILADDMGLGKTLTMISLTMKSIQDGNNDDENENDSDDEVTLIHNKSKIPGGTLVVCPASLIYQWETEINKHVKRNALAKYVHHGQNRENKAKRLSKYDMVMTTYALVLSESERNGPLFAIKWRRVILDEAHQIRNYKSKTFKAIYSLSSKSRWTLTGTPIHNKELDLYALLKFLRCSPFDDLQVWKRWIYKSSGGQDRLRALMSSIILRRTKLQLQEMNQLKSLPEKTWTLITITLDKKELSIYQKVLIFSRTLFAQFLYQRAEKISESLPTSINDHQQEYFKMHKHLVNMNKMKKIKQHEILVLLLRLRQICCHPFLITNMLNKEDGVEFNYDESEEFNLLEQLNKLNLEDENVKANVENNLTEQPEVRLAEASKELFNLTNPVFNKEWKSSKMKVVLEIIKNVLATDDKIIVVSQWTSVLDLLAIQLNDVKVLHLQLNGKIAVNKRMEIVENFNNQNNPTKVLLLSLCAGGVGLNLTGANHLILMDLHWNPQLEIQAQDRVYRVGQSKPVKMYKLMTVETIEERIMQLQEKKLKLAEEVLVGAKIQQSSLSLQDLKLLFNM